MRHALFGSEGAGQRRRSIDGMELLLVYSESMLVSIRRAGLPRTRLWSRHLTTKPSQYGQPLHDSHPHLCMLLSHHRNAHVHLLCALDSSAKDLTPGISAEEYDARRRNLVNSLPDNSVVVAVAAPIKYMSASE